jgi:hypothetical protein
MKGKATSAYSTAYRSRETAASAARPRGHHFRHRLSASPRMNGGHRA